MKILFYKWLFLFIGLIPICNLTASSALYSTGIGLSTVSITEEYQFPFATPQNITATATTPPGVYLATQSIEYGTSDTASAALIVDRNNITIDLNNQIIWCNSTTASIHGIHIKAGVEHVTIKNGTIVGFTGEGIFIEGTDASTNKVSNIRIENIKLISNSNGIIANYVHNATLVNVEVHDSTSSSNVHGIHFSDSDSVSIKDSSSIRNTTSSNSKYVNGMRFTRCKVSNMTNCNCNNNQATGSGAGDATGIYITDTTDDNTSNTITDCHCNGNVSTSGDAHGIHLQTCDLVHIKNCTMTSNRAITAAKSSYGLRLQDADNTTCEGNTIIRNNFGIWDNESLGTQTNLFIKNTAYFNVDKSSNIRDYYRTVSTPINYTQSSVDQLESLSAASNESNISVVIDS